MRYRTVAFAFNAVAGFSFLFLFALPIPLLGIKYTVSWWLAAWPVALGFIIVLLIANWIFLVAGRLFGLIESGDWTGLASTLEPWIIRKDGSPAGGFFPRSCTRLFINACLLCSDYGRLERLENMFRAKAPDALRNNALSFGLSRFVRNDVDGTAAFLQPFIARHGNRDGGWLDFTYGFCLALGGRVADSLPFLRETACSSDPVLALASGYLVWASSSMDTHSETDLVETRAFAESVRSLLVTKFPGALLVKETDMARKEPHVALFGKLLDEAVRWANEIQPQQGPRSSR